MSAAPSPPGWVIQNADAQPFSFTSTVNGVNSLSDQALKMSTSASPDAVILPDNSPGDVAETRVEFSVMTTQQQNASVGIVFGYQDIDNYLAVETLVKAYINDNVEQLVLNEKVNGTTSQLTKTGSFIDVDPSGGWVDIRIQVFRPSSSEVSFRVSAADHGNKYQSLGTTTFQDSELNFTSGDVGLTCGRLPNDSDTDVAIDGDAVGSGGRPIKMYWA